MKTETPIVANDIIEGTVTAHVHMQIPTKALIEWVNQAYETDAIFYWMDDVRGRKKALLEIGGLVHHYTYQFEVLAGGNFDDAKWHAINVETILRGIEAILSGKIKLNSRLISYIQQGVLEAVTDQTGELDSEGLDCVIQAGLFGEVIYG